MSTTGDFYLRFPSKPKKCQECPCSNYYWETEGIYGCNYEERDLTEDEYTNKAPEWCPIMEVPAAKPGTGV